MRLGGIAGAASVAVLALTACGGSTQHSDPPIPVTARGTASAVADTPTPGPAERCSEGLGDIEAPIDDAIQNAPADPDADLAKASAALAANLLLRSAQAQADGRLLIQRTRSYVALDRTTPTAGAQGLGSPLYLAYEQARATVGVLESDCVAALS